MKTNNNNSWQQKDDYAKLKKPAQKMCNWRANHIEESQG